MDNQLSFFADEQEPIPESLDISVFREAIDFEKSQEMFAQLREEIEWQQETIKMFGNEIDIPRLTAWHGDPDRSYTYSGIALKPLAWTPLLNDLRREVERLAASEFNSVLLNLYRNGVDSVSWHADDEPDLGREPVIGSVSLGARRRFDFRKKSDHRSKFSVVLDSGDVIIMRGITQNLWEHQIPKQPKVHEARINLTFRYIRNLYSN
jgi:alkylated DNA repair dioxygenase AlkB